jgi:iron(III) transport system substrate-binding protein
MTDDKPREFASMTYRSYLRQGAVALGSLALAATFATGVSAANNDAVFNYKGADRQKFMEDGAKKEGTLLLYAVATQLKPIMDKFQEKYPAVRLELGRGESAEIARRLFEESKAGRHDADGLELTGGGLLAIRSMGLLAPYYTPHMEAIDPRSIQQEKLWVSARESYGGIGYNTKVFPPAEAPKIWQDLLNPKYKGKMGVTGSPSNAGNWAGILILTYGDDFFRKLGQEQEVRVFNVTSRAVANLTVTGEVPISARASNAHMIESKAKGASVEWVDPGPVAVSDNSLAVLKDAPHPHAMMLMIDFLLSKEGQEMYGDLGYDSARKDITGGSKPKDKVYLEHRPNFEREFDDWVAKFNRYFKVKG